MTSPKPARGLAGLIEAVEAGLGIITNPARQADWLEAMAEQHELKAKDFRAKALELRNPKPGIHLVDTPVKTGDDHAESEHP